MNKLGQYLFRISVIFITSLALFSKAFVGNLTKKELFSRPLQCQRPPHSLTQTLWYLHRDADRAYQGFKKNGKLKLQLASHSERLSANQTRLFAVEQNIKDIAENFPSYEVSSEKLFNPISRVTLIELQKEKNILKENIYLETVAISKLSREKLLLERLRRQIVVLRKTHNFYMQTLTTNAMNNIVTQLNLKNIQGSSWVKTNLKKNLRDAQAHFSCDYIAMLEKRKKAVPTYATLKRAFNKITASKIPEFHSLEEEVAYYDGIEERQIRYPKPKNTPQVIEQPSQDFIAEKPIQKSSQSAI